MQHETIIGVDLSGPGTERDTGVVSAVATGDRLEFVGEHLGSDDAILGLVRSVGRPIVVGVDAPLSYQPGGGQRDRDAELRQHLIKAGLPAGSVMAPTFQRMAWLTLRGIGLAQVLRQEGCAVVEVHPSGCMALRKAPIADVRNFKADARCRQHLLTWLASVGFEKLEVADGCSSHVVAACAAALAAFGWRRGASAWRAGAEPPWHPYDFAC
jgi:predicted nuclease with RNAse H fold